MRLKKLPQGASLDAILLTFIKLVTTVLGLAITRNAVLMHKGTITVTSKEGEGSIFTVKMPLTHVR
jgi:signal transduction histidine kinase